MKVKNVAADLASLQQTCPVYVAACGRRPSTRARRDAVVGRRRLRRRIHSVLSAVGSECPPARSHHGLLSAIRSDEATMNDVHYLRSVGCSRTPNTNVQRGGSLTEIANGLHRIVRRGVPAPQIGYWIHDSFTALEWPLWRRRLLCVTRPALLVSPKRASQ